MELQICILNEDKPYKDRIIYAINTITKTSITMNFIKFMSMKKKYKNFKPINVFKTPNEAKYFRENFDFYSFCEKYKN